MTEMAGKSLRETIVAQFRQPRGLLGEIAGMIMARRPSNVRRNEWTVDLLDLAPHHVVLELGCGPGLALERCAGRLTTGQAVGIDHSAVMVRQARRRLARHIRDGSAEVRHGDVEGLATIEEQFDRIFSLNVIQFVPDQQRLFRLIRNSLRPDGMVATTYQPRTANPTHSQALDMADRIEAAMCETGFGDIARHALPLDPVPAVCVTGRPG
jgi:trans-aconitate methyltransferase